MTSHRNGLTVRVRIPAGRASNLGRPRAPCTVHAVAMHSSNRARCHHGPGFPTPSFPSRSRPVSLLPRRRGQLAGSVLHTQFPSSKGIAIEPVRGAQRVGAWRREGFANCLPLRGVLRGCWTGRGARYGTVQDIIHGQRGSRADNLARGLRAWSGTADCAAQHSNR
jgi:hypothetical protein